MSDTIRVKVYTSNSENKIATIFKNDKVFYVEHKKLEPPTGDLGYKMPQEGIPRQMYESAKLTYERQFNSKMLVVGGYFFQTEKEAIDNAESFVYEDA